MPFWTKKEPEQTPHVEPGMGTSGRVEPNPIKFSDEPRLGASAPGHSSNSASQVDEFIVHPGAIGSKPAPGNGRDDFATMTQPPSAPSRPAPQPAREMPMHVEEPAFSAPSSPAPQAAQAPEPIAKAMSEEAPKKAKTGWFKRAPKAAPQKSFGDEQEREQKWIRARRRFVGTLVLLVTVAIGASIFFDKAPPSPEVTIPLRIPKENSVDVSKITVPASQIVDNKEVAEQTQPAMPSDNKESVPAAPAAKAPAVNAAAGNEKKEPAAEATQPAAEDKKAAAKKAEEQKKAAEAKRQEELKKKAEEAKKQEDKNAAPKLTKGQYYLQVVALSNEGRAKALVDRMKKAGVPAYLSPVQIKSGKVYRVQAGPFKSAKEAEEANGKLGIHGLTPGKVLQSR